MGLRKIIHQNILKMKKIYYLTLAAMLAGAGATGMASAKKFRALASPDAFSAAVAKKQSALTMSSVCNSPKGAALANSEPDAAISNTEGGDCSPEPMVNRGFTIRNSLSTRNATHTPARNSR